MLNSFRAYRTSARAEEVKGNEFFDPTTTGHGGPNNMDQRGSVPYILLHNMHSRKKYLVAKVRVAKNLQNVFHI
jgi:hypothetical protein